MDPHSVNLVIYHAGCSDGMGAAFAAWKLLGSRATYHAATHGSPPPDVTGKTVVCLDFAYPKEVTTSLVAASDNFLVIDHHKSAMVDLCDIPEARFDLSKSGAILSWEFFHPGKEPPKFLRYIQDRDLWKWELPYSREFSSSFDMVPFTFEDYDNFCDDSVFDDAVQRGGYVLSHQRACVAKISGRSEVRTLKGRTAQVVNSAYWISEIGHSLSKQAEVGVVWWYDHKESVCRVSLRTLQEDVDVSEIAKSFGGGGHRPSAGFVHSGPSIEDIFDR